MANINDCTGQLFQLDRPLDGRGGVPENEFLRHIQTRSNWSFLTQDGTQLKNRINRLVRENNDSEFRALDNELFTNLQQIKTHEKVTKNNGTHLNERQLKQHAEKSYQRIDHIRGEIKKAQVNFAKGSSPLYDKVNTFYSHHSVELNREIGRLEAANTRPNTPVPVNTLNARTQAEIDRFLHGTPEGATFTARNARRGRGARTITLTELQAAQGKLENWHDAALGKVEQLLEGKSKALAEMDEFLAKEAAYVEGVSKVKYVPKGTVVAVEKALETTTETAALKGGEKEAKNFFSRLFAKATGAHGTWGQVESIGLGAVSAGLAYDAIQRATGSVSTADVQNGEAPASKPGNIPIAVAEGVLAAVAAATAARTHTK